MSVKRIMVMMLAMSATTVWGAEDGLKEIKNGLAKLKGFIGDYQIKELEKKIEEIQKTYKLIEHLNDKKKEGDEAQRKIASAAASAPLLKKLKSERVSRTPGEHQRREFKTVNWLKMSILDQTEVEEAIKAYWKENNVQDVSFKETSELSKDFKKEKGKAIYVNNAPWGIYEVKAVTGGAKNKGIATVRRFVRNVKGYKNFSEKFSLDTDVKKNVGLQKIYYGDLVRLSEQESHFDRYNKSLENHDFDWYFRDLERQIGEIYQSLTTASKGKLEKEKTFDYREFNIGNLNRQFEELTHLALGKPPKHRLCVQFFVDSLSDELFAYGNTMIARWPWSIERIFGKLEGQKISKMIDLLRTHQELASNLPSPLGASLFKWFREEYPPNTSAKESIKIKISLKKEWFKDEKNKVSENLKAIEEWTLPIAFYIKKTDNSSEQVKEWNTLQSIRNLGHKADGLMSLEGDVYQGKNTLLGFTAAANGLSFNNFIFKFIFDTKYKDLEEKAARAVGKMLGRLSSFVWHGDCHEGNIIVPTSEIFKSLIQGTKYKKMRVQAIDTGTAQILKTNEKHDLRDLSYLLNSLLNTGIKNFLIGKDEYYTKKATPPSTRAQLGITFKESIISSVVQGFFGEIPEKTRVDVLKELEEKMRAYWENTEGTENGPDGVYWGNPCCDASRQDDDPLEKDKGKDVFNSYLDLIKEAVNNPPKSTA